MRLGWIGFHQEGVPALQSLLEAGAPLQAAITLAPEVARTRSGAADYETLCRQFHLPLHPVANINAPAARELLRRMELDVVFVIGWSQILHAETLHTARIGMIGAHASLLPHNRGSAPINWALIQGEHVTGNSLIWLAEGVDAGDLIDQTEFPITPYDTCATLYERVAESNRDMIMRALPRLLRGERPGTPQPKSSGAVLPRRRPVWQAALLPPGTAATAGLTPGAVLGPMLSPAETACGQVVACRGGGAVTLLEVEADDGTVLWGPQLAEQGWTGKSWGHG